MFHLFQAHTCTARPRTILAVFGSTFDMASTKSAVTVVVAALLSGVAAQCPNLTPVSQPSLAEGYSARLVLNGLDSPRSLQFDTEGNLLILEQGAGVQYVKLTDNGGTDVCAASQKQLIPNTQVCQSTLTLNDFPGDEPNLRNRSSTTASLCPRMARRFTHRLLQ